MVEIFLARNKKEIHKVINEKNYILCDNIEM